MTTRPLQGQTRRPSRNPMGPTSPRRPAGPAAPRSSGPAGGPPGQGMYVALGHVPNIDYDDRGGYSGFGGHPQDDGAIRYVPVKTLREAQEACMDFRDENGLGGGNWGTECGKVYRDGAEVARISYNGRVWPPGEWKPGRQEITELDAQRQHRLSGAFPNWLASLQGYSGDLLTESEWGNPAAWPNDESFHTAREALRLFRSSQRRQAAVQVIQAMRIANGAVTRREGRRGMQTQRRSGGAPAPARTRQAHRRTAAEDWDALLGGGEMGGGEPAGVEIELDMPVSDSIDGGEFADLLEEPGEKAPVELSKKDVGLLREALESKLDTAEEDEAKLIKGLLGKMKGIGNAILTPMDEEEDAEGEHAEPDGDEGAGLDDELMLTDGGGEGGESESESGAGESEIEEDPERDRG